MIKKRAKTIYINSDVVEQLGDCNFSERVNELIIKGLEYEKNGDNLTMRKIIEFLLQSYNSKHPNSPIN